MLKFLDEVFHGRTEIVWWLQDLESLRAKFTKFHGKECAERIPFKDVMKHVQIIRTLVLQNAPFVECICPANEVSCPLCKGSRWLTAAEHQEELYAARTQPS